jgi:Flp pilus assembly pilin Flp
MLTTPREILSSGIGTSVAIHSCRHTINNFNSFHEKNVMQTKLIGTFVSDQKAATTTEYAVMLALIALVCIAAIIAVGGESSFAWDTSVHEFDRALNR